MSGFEKLTVAVLAAGQSSRYGANKLEQVLAGEALALHVARTIAGLPFARRLAVCSAERGSVPDGFRALGIEVLVNPSPEAGQSSSLAIASRAARTGHSEGLVICLADMPLVSAGLLRALVDAWATDPEGAVVSVAGTYRGPPAILPSSMFDAVEAGTGDRGARDLLAKARGVIAASAELIDVDRPADLEQIKG